MIAFNIVSDQISSQETIMFMSTFYQSSLDQYRKNQKYNLKEAKHILKMSTSQFNKFVQQFAINNYLNLSWMHFCTYGPVLNNFKEYEQFYSTN